MRRSLIELLAERQIVHPTRIERATIRNACLEVVTSGYPWWRSGEKLSESMLVLSFDGLSDGTLSVRVTGNNVYDEALEDFSIRSLKSIDWAQQHSHVIYCSGPLPNPAALYAKLQDYLQSRGAFRDVSDYLNEGHSLRAFSTMTANASYCLGRCSAPVFQLLSEELTAQRVPHILVENPSPPEERLWVRLDGSDFLCTDAWAEIVP